MKQFNIQSTSDPQFMAQVLDKIDNLTKPKGSLGRLESLAAQMCMIQHTLAPELRNPSNILFAADHGILAQGVSVSPKEVTWQQSYHFLEGGAGISFLCRQHGFRLMVVDAGIDHDMDYSSGIINMKVRKGTRDFSQEAAITPQEFELCLERGAECVDKVSADGCNVISLGEMGCGNTSASSVWMNLLADIPLAQCIGAGAGLDSQGVIHKLEVLTGAVRKFRAGRKTYSVKDILCYFGGLEMVMAVGAMLRAAELRMVILVDGFIMSACMLAASKLCPEVLDYAVFGHQGDESGHKLLLESMNARPLLHLDLRLGEGSGAVCAYPIVQSAVRMINEMDTFRKASVTKYF
ncbi:MAG: nicotinate-nucleotide--dimethylbenzimidazole phosphoribosyltransferase [Bacteroidaceae bacterium]|nr:nicotinate-nucleotide--dimethylbenzimidazole phosphoribosyltransferase [Bacteroidaceae bacterium]